MPASPEFWIDVGGTFTDCFCRTPDGRLVRHKLLSSGATKGRTGEGSSPDVIIDGLRTKDPAEFWTGYEFHLVGDEGELRERRLVCAFNVETGELVLDAPLKAALRPGMPYELRSGEEAPVLAIRYLLGLPLAAPIPHVAVRLGTTRGTNALITRRGARTAFVTTQGFGDILKIGYQNRPRLFDLAITKRVPLDACVVEIDERVAVDGTVLRPLDVALARARLAEAKRAGIESLAICLLHGFAHPQHEEQLTALAREVGFTEISTSSRLAPLIKIVARGDTTVMDAYLNPILRKYVDELRRSLPAADLRLMTSAGGLVSADRFVGKDSILSGPAGGVVGFTKVAQAAGFTRAIGFDMGGTSTDVSRFDGRYELEYETEKAGVRVVAPMLAVETVAAGGGSLCGFDGVKLIVGPDSAGADPGPACYGRGGPLTVTDVNFFLGKILPQYFPFPLDRPAVEARLAALCTEIASKTGTHYTPVELADGFTRVANANMVKPIRSISIAKGYDPRDYVLVSFGGAAAQHACSVARELGMATVLNHPDSGILSAYGIGLADIVRHAERGIYRPYSPAALDELADTFVELEKKARGEVQAEGIPDGRIAVRNSLDLRYVGVDAALNIPEPQTASYRDAYIAEHRRLYGYVHEKRALEIVAVRVEVTGRVEATNLPTLAKRTEGTNQPIATTTAWFDAQPCETAVYRRCDLLQGDEITGPAILVEEISTTVIEPGWLARVHTHGELILRVAAASLQVASPQAAQWNTADPVLLEIFNNQFAGIAEQMGITLRNTSSSVNVKERLDFSCAVFTSTGDLVVNAPHIPVHLGAMSLTVKSILGDNPTIRPGDVFVTNDPYRGGSHLPDVTVVTPVHDPASSRLLFFTASRAHHAEIGGIRAGSMPPFSKNLAEEGILIQNFKLVDAGESRMDSLGTLLAGGPFPSRSVHDNLADVSAQVAANQQGVRDLSRMIERYTLPMVEAYMGHIQRAAERKMRQALAKLPAGRHTFLEHLDDGSPIQVAVTVHGDAAEIDFTGSGPVLAGNLNANLAIVSAAVMYVMRCLIDEDIPLNQGVLAPITLVVPPGLLNPSAGATPAQSPAVVGGNVETSQRVVDALLGALGLAAASQGTMNNLLFGDRTFGYYETICGGSGATRHAEGADAVHTHMTNTRLTDPEVLELRYPVRLWEFSIRRGSGGSGAHRGGDGIVRRLEFLRPLEVSILSQRRGKYAPFGIVGGSPGALGHNSLRRADGQEEPLAGQVEFAAKAGDLLTVQTPGGGGWGEVGS